MCLVVDSSDSWHHKIIYKINLVITSRLNSEYIIMFRLKHWKQFIVSSIHNSHRTSYKRAFLFTVFVLLWELFLPSSLYSESEGPKRHLSYEEESSHSLTCCWIFFSALSDSKHLRIWLNHHFASYHHFSLWELMSFASFYLPAGRHGLLTVTSMKVRIAQQILH